MKRLLLILGILSAVFFACNSTGETDEDHAQVVRDEMRSQDEEDAGEMLESLLDSLAADADSLIEEMDLERAEEQLIESIEEGIED
jgi:hypothetical protein